MNKFVILFILLAGAFLRFWQLDSIPPSLSHDEVAIGYNAYSILKTGKDEYGNILPLLFRSFDDYKLPGMVYASIPSIALFGLNEWGVRIPSALLGTLTVFVFYFFAKELFSTKQPLPLIATAMLAISPWHINFSRQSFESNGALFFFLVGSYFLITFARKPKSLLFAAVFYAISIYFYYSVRPLLPFVLLTFLIVYRKEIIKHIRIVLFSLLIGFFILFPLLPSMFSVGGFSRISTVSVVNDAGYIERKQNFAQRIAENDNFATRSIFNRRVALALTVGENYLKNISPQYIFFSGTDSMGLLHIFEAPFFLLGIFYLFKLKIKAKWLLVAWLFSAPFAGALTVEQPNSLRTLPNSAMFALLSGIGIWTVLGRLEKLGRLGKWGVIAGGGIVVVSLLQFVRIYFYEYPPKNALHFGDGYKQMVSYVEGNQDKFDKVYISGYYWRPYIFTLFWQQYDPWIYQQSGTKEHFDKYHFGRASWDKEGIFLGDPKATFEKNALVILAPTEYETHKDKLAKISTIDGKFAKNVFIAAIAD